MCYPPGVFGAVDGGICFAGRVREVFELSGCRRNWPQSSDGSTLRIYSSFLVMHVRLDCPVVRDLENSWRRRWLPTIASSFVPADRQTFKCSEFEPHQGLSITWFDDCGIVASCETSLRNVVVKMTCVHPSTKQTTIGTLHQAQYRSHYHHL